MTLRAPVLVIAAALSAACGVRTPLVATPSSPDEHGLGKVGPCLDGTEVDHRKIDAPPTVVGRIVEIRLDALTIEPEHPRTGQPASIVVPLSDGTVLCTVLGGIVQREQLMPGQNVAAWLPPAEAGRAGEMLGAVAVMLASTEPGIGWPPPR